MSSDSTMVGGTVESLRAYATQHGLTPMESWGRLSITQTTGIDLSSVRRLLEGDNHIEGVAAFGESANVQVVLTEDEPTGEELQQLRDLVATEEERLELLSPATGWIAAEAAVKALTEVTVSYKQQNWCPSVETLNHLLETDWLEVADHLVEGTVVVGAYELSLSCVDHSGPPSILAPVTERPDAGGDEESVWVSFKSLADISAWRQIAIDENREGQELRLALHRDQRTVVEALPATAQGGLELWMWLHATDDANREEALRHVLRLLTANANTLPSGDSTLVLSERHRIALAHENAAEVQRAISEGRTQTRAGLQEARSALSAYTEDTVKIAQATIVAAIGIVAFVARDADALEDWLVWLIMLAAIAGILVVVATRWRRISDITTDILSLRNAFNETNEPLLPELDRTELTTNIDDFKASRRAKLTKLQITFLAVLAISIILAAGSWILSHSDAPGDNGPIVATQEHRPIESELRGPCQDLAIPND